MDFLGPLYPILATLGAAVLLRTIFKLFSIFRTYFLARQNFKKYGGNTSGERSWAVITGATDGIGKALAVAYARNFNIVLVGRSDAKLKDALAEIKAAAPTAKVETFQLDMNTTNDLDFEGLADKLQSLDLGVLVNNAGISSEYPEFWLDQHQRNQEIVQVNIVAQVKLTGVVLPLLVASAKRNNRRALLINVSSISGALPTPLLATYSGSKAFMTTWSKALAAEYRSQKVDVEVLTPAYVASKMSKLRPGPTTPTPLAYAKSTVNSVGDRAGFFVHEILLWIVHELYYWLPGFTTSKNLGMHLSIRKRALAKKQATQAKKD